MSKKIIVFSSILCFISISLLHAQNNAPEVVYTDGKLTISTTVASNTYLYAVWINNSKPTFIRTLTRYGNKYLNELKSWTTDSGNNSVNATTGATKSSAATIVSIWNVKDQADINIVPDGIYTAKIEMTTESYGTNSKLVTGTFTKGPVPQTITPNSVSPINSVSIKWEPVKTDFVNVEVEKLYKVYPNPAISSIYVSGMNIDKVDICNLNGQCLISSCKQRVDITSLPKGFYLVAIFTETEMIVKKIEKR